MTVSIDRLSMITLTINLKLFAATSSNRYRKYRKKKKKKEKKGKTV